MQLVTPEQIAAVMALAPAPHSFAELDEQVAEGLPKAALKAGVERLGRNADERRILLHRVVPEATFKRRRDRLTVVKGTKVTAEFDPWHPFSRASRLTGLVRAVLGWRCSARPDTHPPFRPPINDSYQDVSANSGMRP